MVFVSTQDTAELFCAPIECAHRSRGIAAGGPPASAWSGGCFNYSLCVCVSSFLSSSLSMSPNLPGTSATWPTKLFNIQFERPTQCTHKFFANSFSGDFCTIPKCSTKKRISVGCTRFFNSCRFSLLQQCLHYKRIAKIMRAQQRAIS